MLELRGDFVDQNLDEILLREEDFFCGLVEKFKGDLIFDSFGVFVEEEIFEQNLQQIFKHIFIFRVVESVDKHLEATVQKMVILMFGRIFVAALEDIHDKLMNGIEVLLVIDL